MIETPPPRRSELAVTAEATYHPDDDPAPITPCGDGPCWHYRNRRPCPEDPWADLSETRSA